jgi:RNA polymerase sigma factor (sigma-70 family)
MKGPVATRPFKVAESKVAAEGLEISRLQSVADQDRNAFDALYRDYYPRLMDFLSRIAPHGGLAEEVVNDTMYVVWTRAGTFAGRSRVWTWIFGIAYKQAIKRLQRKSRLRLDKLPADWETLAENVSVDGDISKLQLQESLDKALQQLSASHRTVVELTYHFGYSYVEISKIVGCPVYTVKTRMFHARARLRRIMETLARRE